MSTGLLSQLDDLYTHIDECQTPIGSHEVATMLPSVRELPVATGAFDAEPRRPALWVGLAAAAFVLVLFGVVSLLTITSETDIPPATDSPPVTTATSPPTTTAALDEEPPWSGLTEDIPEGVESGTVTTPLGSARWVHLNSDEYLLPSLGQLSRNDIGGYTVDGLKIFVASDSRLEFWESDDGITWQGEIGAAERALTWPEMHVDGSYGTQWSINTDPLEMVAGDYVRGVEVDLTGLVPPDSDGFTWTLDVSKPLTRYTSKFTTQSVFHVRFSGPDDQLDQRLLVIEHREPPPSPGTYLDVPWDVDNDVSLYGTSDTLFAYVGDPNSNQVSAWRSNDGYDWTESDGLHEQLGAPASSSLKLTVLPAIGLAWYVDCAPPTRECDDSRGSEYLRNQVAVVTTPGYGWESTDGVNWTPAPDGSPGDTDLIRLESGWFATDGDAWWMHLGDRWVSLADLGMERTRDGCQIVPRGTGQTTVFFSTGTCTPDSSQQSTTDLWIISVDS